MLEIIADKWQTVFITAFFSWRKYSYHSKNRITSFSDKQNRQAKERSLGGPVCHVRFVHIVYSRYTLQGHNGVHLSSKHCHKTAQSSKFQGFKRYHNVKLDEKLSGYTYGIKSDCKRSYFNLGKVLNGVPGDQYLNWYCF